MAPPKRILVINGEDEHMSRSLRSDCPIAATLDIIGDRWTLLVLRDILIGGKSHFSEFAEGESIASNVLTDRLNTLVDQEIIERLPDPDDGRKYIYRPLAPAIELLPVIAELAAWGLKHSTVDSPPDGNPLADPATRKKLVDKLTRQLLAEPTQSQNDPTALKG
ncbi:MAG: helix-turn-helix domain-containing protein [Actinomycetota bacterium]|jgi:DNA-binding HxlR family transcriptional regulator|nr:helix-turn-helix domain-containing protein [Actinomycetota bacterium]